MKRRDFIKISCGAFSGVALGGLGVNLMPLEAHAAVINKASRVKAATQSTSICAHCAVGCGLICSTNKSTGTIINVEGDPEHPINEGSLCAKGAAMYQTSLANKNRLTKVLYRAPFTDKWVEKSWDFAINRIAEKLKAERDKSFITTNKDGKTVNRVETIAQLGSSNIDNEECWTMTLFARSLGLVNIDHQARI